MTARQYEGTPLEFVYDSERATHPTPQDGPTMPAAELPVGGLQTQHTPGPWSYDMNRHTHDYVIFQEGAQHSDHVRKHGCIDDGGVVGSSEWIWIEEADARLIAAAPCLLEAARPFDVTEWFASGVLTDSRTDVITIKLEVAGTTYEPVTVTIGQLRALSAAIARATGAV